ncbi:MAG: TIGR04282 family arsenosugar biosynthesis glycosyltransferase [Candidatus Omnitrophica bacterium]|nr:TIGR04282 family arsenosugar biosynthesis glycosyltransferase [Candidatus Omnitrophota bacterium]
MNRPRVAARSSTVSDWVMVFVKAPSAGQVKTRLCPPLSATHAAELYRCLVYDTLASLSRLPAQLAIAYAANSEFPDLSWLSTAAHRGSGIVLPQQGRSLGERLRHAFSSAFANGATRVVAVGSDAPELSASWLREAISALDHAELVIGPATDGGYHLIGMVKLYPSLFQRMPWSTPALLDRTLARARELGLRAHRLAPIADLDVPEDLYRYLRRLRARSERDATAAGARAAAYVLRLSHTGLAWTRPRRRLEARSAR